MISRAVIINKINAIPNCPTHVAQVGRDLEGTYEDYEVEDILVAALLDANMRSYELQCKLYELLDGERGYRTDPKSFDPKIVESLRELVG